MKYPQIKKNLIKVYDELAEYWGSDGSLHDWGEESLKEFAKLVGKSGGTDVLELGCGSGTQSKRLWEAGMKVVGIDISPNMVLEAKKRVPEANFLVGDMTNITFRANSFDGVYARASLLHVPKQLVPRVLFNTSKVLKTGGYLYLAVKEGKGEGEVEDVRHGINVRRFFSLFVKEEIEKLLENAGFEILDLTTYKREGGSTTWIQAIAKKV